MNILAVRSLAGQLFYASKDMKRIAIQGYRGCFHEEAARLFYEVRASKLGVVECPTFESLFQALSEGRADGGHGDREHHLRRVASQLRTASQPFLADPGRGLHSHSPSSHGPSGPVAAGHNRSTDALHGDQQTRRFFERNCPWIVLRESEDTAKSATDIAEGGLRGVAAVASELAAQQNGLEILARGIETYKQNFTRFLILDDAIIVPRTRINKASLCFTLPHKPGSLAQILTILSFYDMNLTASSPCRSRDANGSTFSMRTSLARPITATNRLSKLSNP